MLLILLPWAMVHLTHSNTSARAAAGHEANNFCVLPKVESESNREPWGCIAWINLGFVSKVKNYMGLWLFVLWNGFLWRESCISNGKSNKIVSFLSSQLFKWITIARSEKQEAQAHTHTHRERNTNTKIHEWMPNHYRKHSSE